MKREIKFRFYDQKLKKYIYSDECSDLDNFFWLYYTGNKYSYPILEQYTGIKDQNHLEIYEGDIVRVTHNGKYKSNFDCGIGVVEYILPYCVYYISGKVHNGISDLYNFYDFEVIGNIHDNPELMTGDDKLKQK